MSDTAGKNLILEGIHYKTNKPVKLEISGNRIVKITAGEAGTSNLPLAAPGLIDIQINGYNGVDFNSPVLTPGQVEKVSEELLRTGVTGYFPTLITSPPEYFTHQITVFRDAINHPLSSAMIRGIHLEGPFISMEDGPRGAHMKKFCILPNFELVKQWQDAAEGLIRIITLAPELPGAVSLISNCVKSGITVGIGHTAASADQLKEAVDNGARLSTHLGNGAHNTLPRHPNYIWEQLAEDRLYASMIADGFHLPDSVLKVFIKVKREKAILVSDGMQYTGMKPGSYTSPQTGGVVLCADGRLHLEGNREILAGSAKTLREGIIKIMAFESPDFAWDMASLHPSELMNLDTGRGISVGAPADLILFEKSDNDLKILRVILNGRVCKLN